MPLRGTVLAEANWTLRLAVRVSLSTHLAPLRGLILVEQFCVVLDLLVQLADIVELLKVFRLFANAALLNS